MNGLTLLAAIITLVAVIFVMLAQPWKNEADDSTKRKK